MRLFRRPYFYIQVFPDHFASRVVGGDRRIRRDCHALDNRRAELKDFTRIREAMRTMFRDLSPGFSLRRPIGLLHFIPEHYSPTHDELRNFKKSAERAGLVFCWLSKWDNPHTDAELHSVFGGL
jgi:hypothetical protein